MIKNPLSVIAALTISAFIYSVISNDKSSSPFEVLLLDSSTAGDNATASKSDTYSETSQVILSPSDAKFELSLSEKYIVSLPIPSSKLFTKLYNSKL